MSPHIVSKIMCGVPRMINYTAEVREQYTTLQYNSCCEYKHFVLYLILVFDYTLVIIRILYYINYSLTIF